MLASIAAFIKSADSRNRFIRSFPSMERALELGCGPATNCRYITAHFPEAEMHGVDILPAERMPDFVRYQVVNLDADPLPYPDAHFDCIIFTHVLEHLKTPWHVGAEIHRVLKPGGRIYVEVPNWTSMFVPSFRFMRSQRYPFNFFDDITHIKPWSLQGIHDFLVDACALEVRRSGKMRNWVRVFADPFIMLFGLIALRRPIITTSIWNLFGLSIYGVGRKPR